MVEHYQHQHDTWDGDVFGCTHTDQETHLTVIPDYCPFCGVSLGSDDIEMRDWPPETETGSHPNN